LCALSFSSAIFFILVSSEPLRDALRHIDASQTASRLTVFAFALL
jgi:hypothetical protein